MHTDERLDRLGEEAAGQWAAIGGEPRAIELGMEGAEHDVPALTGIEAEPARPSPAIEAL
jgi:hypothetical protein